MNAWVAVTDLDWFDFLSRQENVDEVNFWQPNPWGGQFRVLRRGELMLFKLKRPVNAIAGGGFFEYYVDLPISVAWDSFGRKNGAASLHELRESIASLRGRDVPWYEDCRESRHLAPLETPSFTHPPLAEFGEFGTLRDDFTHGGHRWPNWERSRSWSQRTWCTKAPRSGRSPGRWA